ncbi:MAG: hypothetical protein DRI69_01405 [Bacteroidetes bacterium]|nr:MAG: hypothetical protein DRI69_01405 [Bacteroidota bacterium]
MVINQIGVYYWILQVYNDMKKLSCFLLILLAVWWKSNISFAQGVIINFESAICHVIDVEYYDSVAPENLDRSDKRFLLTSSFGTDSYEEYKTYFLPEECHVTEETFYEWKSTFGNSTPDIKAAFTLEIEGADISVIQYALEYNGNSFLGPFTQKRIGDDWFLMRAEDVVRLVNVTSFFSLVKEEFMDAIMNGPIAESSKYYSNEVYSNNELDGGKLVQVYLNKYDSRESLHDLLNDVFEDRVQFVKNDPLYRDRNAALQNLILNSNLTEGEVEFLTNLIEANLFAVAIEELGELTEMSDGEILTEIGERIKKERN